MRVSVDEPQFRPVHITLETQDELDQLLAILRAVKNNSINHLPQTIHCARVFYNNLEMYLE